jgi:hypothetical protein
MLSRLGVLAVGVVAFGVSAVACSHEESADSTPAPAAESASARPSDHLAPDELLEGPDKAFGLALPRGSQVQSRFTDSVTATTIAHIAPLVSYVRARVREGTISKGATSATFEHVRIPGDPSHEYRIRLREAGGHGATLAVDDTTPPPDTGGTQEERERALGLTKDGKIADPTHLE